MPEGASYKTPRTAENWARACKEAGLDDLAAEDAAEREYYGNLMWDLWVLFDDELRAVVGVEIDLEVGISLDHSRVNWDPPEHSAGLQ